MTADDLFDAAVELPPDQRSSWLLANCADAELRAEVHALLRAHDETDAIFDRPALKLAGPLMDSMRRDRIGTYRILREIGRGGMGVVYLAERDDGQYRQRVAIKLLRNTPDTEELHRRFVAERQILASLNHPNIAQLLDGGVTDGDLPYLVMEYVDGVPITTYCDRQQLTVEERLRLFRDVCAAVHHAHQNLVIHRDIKPSNILVTNEGRVKLLDFGIAKLMNPTLGPANQPLTRTEWRVMTPEYASPEQVRGETLTTASDVYALGVLLYELVSGRRPHRITSGSPRELEEMIVQREPALPSVAVSRAEPARPDGDPTELSSDAIAAGRNLPIERLRRRLAGDLDAIVMMALRKESARRYSSADVLWEDIQRHLDGLPVLAHRPSRWYRTRKFLGRHRVEAIAAAVVAVSLIGGTTVAVRQAAVAGRERDRAEQALGQSKEVTSFLVRLFRTPAPAGATRDQVTARDMLATGTAGVEALRDQPVVQAQMFDALGQVNDQLGRFAEAERMFRRALDLRRTHLGQNHVDVAATLNNLANVLAQTDRREESLALSREALAIQQRALGPVHPEVASTLGAIARRIGDLPAAESLYRRVRDIQRATMGPEHRAVALTSRDLADNLAAQGKNEAAEATLRETLAIQRHLSGADRASAATTMVVLANLLRSQRIKSAEVESLYYGALDILKREAADRPSRLVGPLYGLEEIAHSRGDHVRAESLAREVFEVQRRTIGTEHPMVTESMDVIAEHLAARGRHEEAERVLRDAIALIQRTAGANHFRMADRLNTLGRVRLAAGQLDSAETALRQALAISERVQGLTGESVATDAALLAAVLDRRGKVAEAKSLFDRAAAIFRSVPERAGYGTRAAYAALADHYQKLGQTSDADFFRKRAR